MKCGDLSLAELRDKYKLENISNVLDPYTMQRITAFNSPQSRYFGTLNNLSAKSISIANAANLLFDEMRKTSWPYSWYGEKKNLINKMLTHFQCASGATYSDVDINSAYRSQITNDNSLGSTRRRIIELINKNIDLNTKSLPPEMLPKFQHEISALILPKFNSFTDKINGLGITIHDVYATKIKLNALHVDDKAWKATLLYTAQDHFGLDDYDIGKLKFKQFQFFKIWFLLQRCKIFSFKPFMTNMEAIINIAGTAE